MKVNHLKMFLKLYEKEMMELKTEILLTISAVIVVSVLVYFAGPRFGWPNLLFVMVAGLAGLLPVITASKIFTKEWNSNTIYLVMSLPVRGGMILGSKLAAVVSQYLLGTITVVISTITLALVLFAEEIAIITSEFINIPWGLGFSIYFMSLVFGVYLVALIFFSQIIGKLVAKFQGLTTVITLAGMLWLTNKVIAQLIGHMDYSPELILAPVEPFIYTSFYYIGAAIVVFIAAVLIYNWRIEL
ncbi:MAG TPA: hypothetical protein VFC73_06365 [Syntrophomonadaceae bacterium]|nr:hypothetical protein [Syntrophomonadaceae bacterium]